MSSKVNSNPFVCQDFYFPIEGLIGVLTYENQKAVLSFESQGASLKFRDDVKEAIKNQLRAIVPNLSRRCLNHRKSTHSGLGRRCVLIPLHSYQSVLNAFDWLMTFWKGNSKKLFFGIRLFAIEEVVDIAKELESEKLELALQSSQIAEPSEENSSDPSLFSEPGSMVAASGNVSSCDDVASESFSSNLTSSSSDAASIASSVSYSSSFRNKPPVHGSRKPLKRSQDPLRKKGLILDLSATMPLVAEQLLEAQKGNQMRAFTKDFPSPRGIEKPVSPFCSLESDTLSLSDASDYLSPLSSRFSKSKIFDFATPIRESISDLRELHLKKMTGESRERSSGDLAVVINK